MTKRRHIKKTPPPPQLGSLFFFLLLFLPVFPTPLPPITAILMTRLRGEFSGAEHSAIVVMLWRRRIFLLSTTSIGKSEKANLSAPKCWQCPGRSPRKRLGEADLETVQTVTGYRGSSSAVTAPSRTRLK